MKGLMVCYRNLVEQIQLHIMQLFTDEYVEVSET